MKTNLLLKSAAVAAVLSLASQAHAAGLNIQSGDLILGFQDSSNSIEFNMANIAPVLNAMDGSTHLITNVNTALSTTTGVAGYGASWASNSGITWGVAGKDVANFYTGFRQINDTPLSDLSGGAASANGQFVNAGDTTAAQSNISTLISGANTVPVGGQIKAGGSTLLAAKYANTSGSAWAKFDVNTAGLAFNTFQNGTLLQSNVTATTVGTAGVLSGLTYSALDLYGFTGPAPSPIATFLGTLALTTAGDLYFTAATAAIPEPSVYAALLGAATLGFVAIRRRRQVDLLA